MHDGVVVALSIYRHDPYSTKGHPQILSPCSKVDKINSGWGCDYVRMTIIFNTEQREIVHPSHCDSNVLKSLDLLKHGAKSFMATIPGGSCVCRSSANQV